MKNAVPGRGPATGALSVETVNNRQWRSAGLSLYARDSQTKFPHVEIVSRNFDCPATPRPIPCPPPSDPSAFRLHARCLGMLVFGLACSVCQSIFGVYSRLFVPNSTHSQF
jgi:hypothetical protein